MRQLSWIEVHYLVLPAALATLIAMIVNRVVCQVVSGSWEAEVDRMRDWLFRRVAWLDANIPQSDVDCREVIG